MAKVVISSSITLKGDIGFAYIVFRGNDDICKVGQSVHKVRNIPKQEIDYINAIIRKLIRDGYDITKAYLLVDCLKMRSVKYIEENNLATKALRKSFYEVIDKVGEVCTGYRTGQLDQFMCQVCINISHLSAQGHIETAIVREIISESVNMLGNLKKLSTEYEKRNYTRSMIGVTGKVSVKDNPRRVMYSVMRTGPTCTQTYFVTSDKNIAYKTVSEMNTLLETNGKRTVSRMLRDMSSISFNPEGITDDMVKRWGIGQLKKVQLLEATGNGKYNNYYIEIVKRV